MKVVVSGTSRTMVLPFASLSMTWISLGYWWCAEGGSNCDGGGGGRGRGGGKGVLWE